MQELRLGRALYVERCAGCHPLYPVQWLRPEAWLEAVAEMSGSAKLRGAEVAAVSRYLAAASASP